MRVSTEERKLSWLEMVKSVWYLLGDQKAKYLVLTFIVFVIQFFELVPTFVFGKIVDFFSTYSRGGSLLLFYQYIAFLGISTAIVSFVRLSTKNGLDNIQTKVAYTTRVKGFERLLDFSIKWHDKENTGNKVQKIQNGTGALKDLQRMLSNDVYYELTTIIGVLFAFIFSSPILLAIAFLYLVCFLAVQQRFYKVMVDLNDKYNQLLEEASGTYYEGLSNVLTIKTLGVQKDFEKNITSKEVLTRDHSLKMNKIGINKWKIFQIVNAAFVGIVLLFVGHGFIQGIISLGSIFILSNYFSKLQGAIGSSTNILDQLIYYKSAISRMMPIYWEKITTKQGIKIFPSAWDQITLDHSKFDYRNKERVDAVLDDVSLTIKRFSKIGVVGKSGSGKSTLAKIFLGLYELDSGNYQIGSTNFYDLNHEEMTRNISLVLQDSEMFNLSLQDNITLMREFDQDLFNNAMDISQLNDLVKSLPNGLNTMIGEKGYRLSGGERQRIGIARAIYKDPQILVLDEATSSLDSKTESLILEAMETKLTKKTLIMIAHRVTTLKNVDKIYVFDHGKIVEEGTYKSLSTNPKSRFFELAQITKGE